MMAAMASDAYASERDLLLARGVLRFVCVCVCVCVDKTSLADQSRERRVAWRPHPRACPPRMI
jgi:hypothetical protein